MSTSTQPVAALHARSHSRAAQAALVTLWTELERMRDDEVSAFLTTTGAAFLPGLDVRQVLDALHRDRARRHATRGDAY